MPPDPFDLAARFAAPPVRPPRDREPAEPPASDEVVYLCDACGEEIVVPVDPAAGASQEYVEDCPVCCRPNLLRVRFDAEGRPRCRARAE